MLTGVREGVWVGTLVAERHPLAEGEALRERVSESRGEELMERVGERVMEGLPVGEKTTVMELLAAAEPLVVGALDWVRLTEEVRDRDPLVEGERLPEGLPEELPVPVCFKGVGDAVGKREKVTGWEVAATVPELDSDSLRVVGAGEREAEIVRDAPPVGSVRLALTVRVRVGLPEAVRLTERVRLVQAVADLVAAGRA